MKINRDIMYDFLYNYRILRLLGEGGMSRVYLGEDPKTKQRVAIKELLPQLAHSEDLCNRFRREAQIMAALDHPNIVKLLRYEEDSNGFFLIMEYVEGLNLEQQIQQVTGPISEIKTIEIMSSLLDAFGYAHEKGIIHRDIKPSNIIITREGKAKILDFGIAKIIDDDLGGKTKTGTRMGSVLYMSPEQVKASSDLDLRTDIYSLGVVLFQMITGTAPYDITTESEFAIQTHIVKDSLPIAKNIYPYVPDYIQKIIDKATEKDRNNRFQNCAELKHALIDKENVILKGNISEDLNNPQRQKNNSFQIALGITISIILIIIFVAMASNKSDSSVEQLAAQQADSIRIADSIAAAEAEAAAAAAVDTTAYAADYSNENSEANVERTIYSPYISTKNSSIISIKSITLNKSYTAIEFRIMNSTNEAIAAYTGEPGENDAFYIEADNYYYLTSLTGIGNDKQSITIEPNYYLDFTAYFQPIPLNTKIINLVEGQTNLWGMTGVNLE